MISPGMTSRTTSLKLLKRPNSRHPGSIQNPLRPGEMLHLRKYLQRLPLQQAHESQRRVTMWSVTTQSEGMLQQRVSRSRSPKSKMSVRMMVMILIGNDLRAVSGFLRLFLILSVIDIVIYIIMDGYATHATDHLLQGFHSSGGWVDQDVFGLQPIPGMGIGAMAKRDIPVRSRPFTHLSFRKDVHCSASLTHVYCLTSPLHCEIIWTRQLGIP